MTHAANRCGIAALALWVAVAPVVADTPVKTTSQWKETIAAGATVRVVNLHGNVRCRFGGYGNEVEILAAQQRLEIDRSELEVRRTREGGDLSVIVDPLDLATRDRVDLVVYIPQGAALDVRTGDGLIEAKKLQADLTASSLEGDVMIRSVRGRVRAKSARGKITATLETDVTKLAQRLATETGEIEVWVGEDAHLDVAVATSGEICTDFSIDIEHLPFDEPNKRATAKVGRGGASLELESKQGRVCLRRSQKEFRPE